MQFNHNISLHHFLKPWHVNIIVTCPQISSVRKLTVKIGILVLCHTASSPVPSDLAYIIGAFYTVLYGAFHCAQLGQRPLKTDLFGLAYPAISQH